MSWVILEGVDRSGKSTVADYYVNQGYTLVHMSAPDKKYSQPGYTGPSYLDEMIDLCMKYDGQDVVFDRSWWGEIAPWPIVFDRKPQLSSEDIEIIMEYEANNKALRVLMIDHNTKAHWRRCEENNEPLNYKQFVMANRLYRKLVSDYGFVVKTLHDYTKAQQADSSGTDTDTDKPIEVQCCQDEVAEFHFGVDNDSDKTPEQQRLEQANAINSILGTKIIKKKGQAYEQVETEIRKFLNQRLGVLLGQQAYDFSQEEVQILKQFCQQMHKKLKE